MKHNSAFVFIVVFGLFFFILNPVFSHTNTETIFVKNDSLNIKPPRARFLADEIIIQFTEQTTAKQIESLTKRYGLQTKRTTSKGRFSSYTITKGQSVTGLVNALSKNKNVSFAEPNYYASALFVPNDSLYPLQWNFDNPVYGGINMEEAWDIKTGTSSVVVAVIDGGIAYENYPAPNHCHIDTYRAYGGSGSSWWCGRNDPNFVTEPGYGNGWRDYLMHNFDLTPSIGNVTLSYVYRHDLEKTAGVAYDFAYTEISTDNGGTWTALKTYTGKSKVQGQVGWKSDTLDITGYKGQNVLVRFRVFTDATYSDEDGNFNSDGAFFVDEITLTDSLGTIFYDNAESGTGSWETTQYILAPDLADTQFVDGWDFVNNDAHPNDDAAHGTHVAGTIAGSTNNGFGVAGAAFNTSIMPIKSLDATGSGTYQQIVDGIYFAVDNGAHIINMSLGGSADAQILEDAAAYAYNNGVTVVAACGNSNVSQCDYPARYDSSVIAVGATQYDETKAPYSSYGAGLDIVAPGGNIAVDQNGDGFADGVLQQTFSDTPVDMAYWFYQGTSMATPHVTAVAALLLAKDSTLTPDEIRAALEGTADDLGISGYDTTFGWGVVNPYAALLSIDSPPTINITSPTESSIVTSTIPITIDVSDDNGITGVRYRADGIEIGYTTSSPYSITWDTTSVTNAEHFIDAVAIDTIWQSATSTITVTVDNAPDLDGDGIEDSIDNCPLIPNVLQLDTEGNGTGDVCDMVHIKANSVDFLEELTVNAGDTVQFEATIDPSINVCYSYFLTQYGPLLILCNGWLIDGAWFDFNNNSSAYTFSIPGDYIINLKVFEYFEKERVASFIVHVE